MTKLLASAAGITIRVCDGHDIVNVTVGGTTLHLHGSDFARLAEAVAEAAASLEAASVAPDPDEVH